MRRIGAIGLVLVLLLPAMTASAEGSGEGGAQVSAAPVKPAKVRRHECRRLTRQIAHFEGVAEMAGDRRDELWLGATQDHIRRLEDERIDLCPEYKRPNPLIRFGKGTQKWIKRAARVATAYFTGGLF